MSNIDTLIAEHFAPASDTPQANAGNKETTNANPEPTPNAEASKEVPEPQAGDETNDDKPQGEEFPKKARNALSYRDKKIGKLQAEKQQLLRELELSRQPPANRQQPQQRLNQQVEQQPQQQTPDGYPKEDDFSNWGDYTKALARFEAEQIFKERHRQESESKVRAIDAEWESERGEAMDESAEDAKKQFPDFEKIVGQALQSVEIEPHVFHALLESDKSAYALYALAKDGKLAELNAASPTKAAMMIARYEDKAIELSKPKTPISNAPKPLTPGKGVASSGKSLDQMSGHELLAWSKSKTS